MHHQRVLHAHGRPITRIHPLNFARRQPIGHITHARPAMRFRGHNTEQPLGTHLGHDLAVKSLGFKSLFHARRKLIFSKTAHTIPDHALILAEMAFQIERVFPVKFSGHFSGS